MAISIGSAKNAEAKYIERGFTMSAVTKFKCPQCGEREFAVIKWKQKNSYDSRSKEKALFGCASCDYREVI